MALAMRLSRGGRKGRPFYRIVVADKRMPRDGRYIERLGVYNPLLADNDENRVQLVEDRIKYWLSQGAQPSERVAIFLGKAGILDMPKQPNRPNKSAPSEKTLLKIEDKKEKQAAAKEAAKAAAEEAKAAAEAEAAKPAEEEAPAEAPAEDAAAEAPAEAEAAPAETPAEEAKEEAPAAEEKPAEEAPKEEAKEEAPAEDAKPEEKAEEPKAEEAPAEEEKKEE